MSKSVNQFTRSPDHSISHCLLAIAYWLLHPPPPFISGKTNPKRTQTNPKRTQLWSVGGEWRSVARALERPRPCAPTPMRRKMPQIEERT